MIVKTERKKYENPLVVDYGRVDRLTMGAGGSSLDGTCLYDQRGKGNDGTGPNPPKCDV